MANLAEVIMLGGRAKAESARRAGDIEAQRAANSGAIWGGVANSLGQIGSQAFSSYQQAKAEAPARAQEAELRTLKLQQARDDAAATAAQQAQRKAVGALLTASRKQDLTTGMWTYDEARLQDGLNSLNMPDLWPQVAPLLEASNKSIATARAAQSQALKDVASIVDVAGNDPEVFLHELDRAVQNGLVSEMTAMPWIDAVKRDPKVVGRLTGKLLDKKETPLVTKPGDVLRDPNDPATVIATNPQEPPKAPTPPAAVQEYEYYADQERKAGRTPLDYNAYQTMDANRRRPVTTINTGATEAPYKIDPQSTAILGQTGLTQNAFLAATGQMSSLSRDQKTRNAAAAEWQNYAVAHGIDTSTFIPRYHAITKTLEANALRNNQAEVAEAELDATVTNLKSAADEASFRSLRWGNIAKLFAGQEVNDAAVTKYKFHLEQLRSELAMYNAAIGGQIDANGNIREINQNDLARADSIIRDGFAAGSLDGFAKALTASRSKMRVVLDKSVDIQNKRVWDLFGVGQNYQNSSKSPAADGGTSGPKEGEEREVPGHPGVVAVYRGGKWIVK